MRAIRKRKEEASQSPPGWTEIRPNLFATAGNSTGAEQTNAQHGYPLPARTQLKLSPKNVVLTFSHQFKIVASAEKCKFSKELASEVNAIPMIQTNAAPEIPKPRVARTLTPHQGLWRPGTKLFKWNLTPMPR